MKGKSLYYQMYPKKNSIKEEFLYILTLSNIEKSAYMLINNIALKENPDLIQQIENFFINQYDYFE